MNEVVTAARIAVLATAIRLILAALLLICGWGLLSLPVAALFSSLIQRRLARRRCLELLAGQPAPDTVDVKRNLTILWPNSWRMGVYCVGGYLTLNANTAICLQLLGLAANARYGLSTQVLGIATGMASVWTIVKWPVVGQQLAQHDFQAIQRVLRPRLWLQNLSFLAMAGFLILCGPPLLERFGSGKQLLPSVWLGLLALNSLLEMQYTFWGTAIFLGNRFPFLWYSVTSNLLSLLLSLGLIHFSSLGLGALVLGPLISGCLFNYWYWPLYGARFVGTTLFRFLFGRAVITPTGPGEEETER
jgi:hypothetical protein